MYMTDDMIDLVHRLYDILISLSSSCLSFIVCLSFMLFLYYLCGE